jgi:uncharacterized protein (DUF934 family)
MRPIIRRREIVADDWHYAGETGADDRLVRPLDTFLAEAQAGTLTAGAAVQLGATDEPQALVPWLDRLALIVIEFAAAGDGRGFSQARLLRERYHYPGELRARGLIKRDQLFFLARCGFDAFDLDPSEDLQAALSAFSSFDVAYQGGSDEVVQVRQRSQPL